MENGTIISTCLLNFDLNDMQNKNMCYNKFKNIHKYYRKDLMQVKEAQMLGQFLSCLYVLTASN